MMSWNEWCENLERDIEDTKRATSGMSGKLEGMELLIQSRIMKIGKDTKRDMDNIKDQVNRIENSLLKLHEKLDKTIQTPPSPMATQLTPSSSSNTKRSVRPRSGSWPPDVQERCTWHGKGNKGDKVSELCDYGMEEIANLTNGEIDRFWAQLEASALSDKYREAQAMWPKMQRTLAEGKLKILWRNTRNPEHKQCVLQCTICNESTWRIYRHPEIGTQVTDTCNFLKVDIPNVGTKY